MMKVLRSPLLFVAAMFTSPIGATEFQTMAVVRELDEVDVPAQRDGMISKLLLRRGHRVTAEQLIAELDTTELRLKLRVTLAELKLAEAKAENDGPVDSAKSAMARAEKEDQLLGELGKNAVYLERFRLRNNLERTAAELRTAKNQFLLDQLQADVKVNEVRLLENDLRRATVFSPVDGVIHELLKHQGEWVRQGEPILKITRMDKLVVEGFLDAREIAPHVVSGASVMVTISMAKDQPAQFEGLVIEHPAPKLELDGKFPVWVEIANRLVKDHQGQERWLIRPGMSGQMTVVVK
jgi:multidrug resistance efflux pump